LSFGGDERGIGALLVVGTRLFARLTNKTCRPSGLIIGAHESLLPSAGCP
jgi:hypothetical protein